MTDTKAKAQKPKPGHQADDEWDTLSPEERFIHKARELGCEDNLGRFDEAVKRIGKARRQPQETREAKKEKKPE